MCLCFYSRNFGWISLMTFLLMTYHELAQYLTLAFRVTAKYFSLQRCWLFQFVVLHSLSSIFILCLDICYQVCRNAAKFALWHKFAISPKENVVFLCDRVYFRDNRKAHVVVVGVGRTLLKKFPDILGNL